MNRRKFLAGSAAAGAILSTAPRVQAAASDRPAILGGTPVRRNPFPSWPITDEQEEKAILSVLRSGKWNRGMGQVVNRFEESYSKLMGSHRCLATANGTSALLVTLNTMGIGPGDEVIVPPYTFVATINAILQVGALPVFVDSDGETFQIDARKIEAKITSRTVAIMPVHLGGNVADLDTIMAIAKKRNLPVIEDACQAHLAEWKGKKVGTYGKAGCFSFQASKNLNCGEGGAIITDDPEFTERSYAFHNNSRRRATAGYDFSYVAKGLNLRLTEFQAALLLTQMTRLGKQAGTREQNAQYLTQMLTEIPGIAPARMYPGCTRNAYHLYMFRYDPGHFAGLTRAKFMEAMAAEGVPVSGGYAPLNKEPFIVNTMESRGFKRVYSDRQRSQWAEQNQCPVNDKLCSEAVWLTQTQLLGPRSDMAEIATAMRKIRNSASEIAKGS
ncbi:DegT/DnrJ/EryC1/StrS family aminotransferase [Paludibaculum fermentans]|uniref:DegT/DnrJ/EryC1/StrS family aminotransferase n=1 Tax=Paludibaculum fermentans TaxID=1473598 RepID=UPI003EBC3632